MAWYDTFARVYDVSLERLYRPVRESAFESLEPGHGTVALDLACGTGLNFSQLRSRLGGESLKLLGVDASPGMLQQAQHRINKQKWGNVSVLEADARLLDPAMLARALEGITELDYVVCTLGMTAIPEWERVFDQTFGLLRPGGQFLIMDVWAERWVPQTSCVQLLARADLKRKVWQPLEAASLGFEMRFLKGSPHIHGGRLFVATGFKSIAGSEPTVDPS